MTEILQKRRTMKEKFKCTQPGCSAEYNDKAHLGIHLRAAHGIAGQSPNAIKHRELRHAAKAAKAEAKPEAKSKRKYTKRSELATIPQEANGHIHHTSNGQTQTFSHKNQTQAALTIGLGRFQELSKNLAYEYDLGAKSFAAQFAELIYATTLR
jgi:hypothetical protein